MTGYTTEEKVEIARQHLFPKQLKEHGLTSKDLTIGKKQLEKIVEGYTRESGVRSLEQKIAQVIRNAAKSVAMEEEYNTKVTDEDIVKVLGSVLHSQTYSYLGIFRFWKIDFKGI